MKQAMLCMVALFVFATSNAYPSATKGIIPPEDDGTQMIDVMPQFKGGDIPEFRKWLKSRLRWPTKALKTSVEGKVVATFVIDRDGALTDIEIVKSPSEEFSKELTRVLKKSPKWTPGTVDGKPVRVRFTLPVAFYGR